MSLPDLYNCEIYDEIIVFEKGVWKSKTERKSAKMKIKIFSLKNETI